MTTPRPASRMHHSLWPRERGQSMLEVALVLPVLLILVSGIIDFGFLFSAKIAINNAARNGARYATTHPTAWTNSSTPAANTIEGIIQSAGGTASIPNDDSHILITYLNPDGSTCGHYSQATNTFVGGSQSSCVKAGNLIQVQVTYQYSFLSPALKQLSGANVSLTATATMAEEQ